MTTIAFTTWRGITLATFGARPASREDWAAYVDELRAAPHHRQRALVTTLGGTLENYQRQDLEQVMGPAQGRDRRVAVVTNSTFARGFLRAISRLDASFKAFSQAELDAALDYIEVPPGARAECKQILAALTAQLAPG